MRVMVNGIRVFFDVEGAQLVPDGPRMRERPTLILLHGGPGMDHAHYKPAFSRFADIAQVIYLDHRGNGRSDRADPSTWNLGQWGDDVRSFCDALQIDKPIVLGTSFGGLVAMSYATRHPGHPGKLILASTEARAVTDRVLAAFERLGGPSVRAVAARFLADGDLEALDDYARVCLPLYTRRSTTHHEALARCIANPDVILHYFKTSTGENATVNFLADLARVQCPTLVLAGEDDPITPIENSEDMVAALPSQLVQFERFANTGHTVFDDEPRAYDAVAEFIQSKGQGPFDHQNRISR